MTPLNYFFKKLIERQRNHRLPLDFLLLASYIRESKEHEQPTEPRRDAMTTTDRNHLYAQTTRHLLQRRQGGCYIVDGTTVIALGALTTVQAARQLHDYNVTMANEGVDVQ
jgi:hypothetical protein